jgi:hypothetical protein
MGEAEIENRRVRWYYAAFKISPLAENTDTGITSGAIG